VASDRGGGRRRTRGGDGESSLFHTFQQNVPIDFILGFFKVRFNYDATFFSSFGFMQDFMQSHDPSHDISTLHERSFLALIIFLPFMTVVCSTLISFSA
jgi:hypothetical protein